MIDYSKVLFVTGIDTGIGKTFATTLLLQMMQQKGLRVVSQKPIQTGCIGRSEDLDIHDKGFDFLDSSVRTTAEPYRCSYLLPFPASPHLSAEHEGVEISIDKIDSDTQTLLEMGFDLLIMEGAGGLMVPMTRELLTIDFVAQRHYPITLVCSGRLGSINHTLLSIEAIRHRGLQLEYLIYNHYADSESDPLIVEETARYLQEYLSIHSPQTRWIEMDSLPF